MAESIFMKKEDVLRYPRLDTVLMVEDFVKKHAEKRDFAVHREKEVWSGEQLLKIMVFKKKNI